MTSNPANTALPLTELYMNVDGDTAFLPIEGWSWNAAQAEARRFADDAEPGSKAVYCGQQSARLHDHDEPWDDDDCPRIDCYVFEVEDR